MFIGSSSAVSLELQRVSNHDTAWRATLHATKAVGLSMLIELFGAYLRQGLGRRRIVS